MSPPWFLLLEVDFIVRRSLEQLATAAPRISLRGSERVGNAETWVIEAESPESNVGHLLKRHYEIHLDPARGYMIRKLVIRTPARRLPDGSQSPPTEARLEAVDFRDYGDGVFLPTEIVAQDVIQGSGSQTPPHRWKVIDATVNEPVDEASFKLDFPKYVLVKKFPAKGQIVPVDVWGDGAALATLNGPDELREFLNHKERWATTAAGPGGGGASTVSQPSKTTWLWASLALGAIAIVAIVVLRRVRATD